MLSANKKNTYRDLYAIIFFSLGAHTFILFQFMFSLRSLGCTRLDPVCRRFLWFKASLYMIRYYCCFFGILILLYYAFALKPPRKIQLHWVYDEKKRMKHCFTRGSHHFSMFFITIANHLIRRSKKIQTTTTALSLKQTKKHWYLESATIITRHMSLTQTI